MRYKDLQKQYPGSFPYNPSLLGLGCMRFPTLEDGKIDVPQVKEMFKYAFAHGVNYVDTAWPYHGGESENVVGEVIQDYDRSSFYLATKLPMWAINTLEDAKRIFNEQLKKLKTDYVDFYLLHAMNKQKWDVALRENIIPWLEEMQCDGKIRHLGFSFHDNYDTFEEIITYRKWEFCQLQINYMDIDTQAEIRGYELAKKLGTFVIVMEPLKGGQLVNLSDEVKDIFKAQNNDRCIDWAFRYVASLDNVKIILSGMSSIEQVKDNIQIFDNIQDLNEEEQKTVEQAKNMILSLTNNSCTGCRYCMPCPNEVDIPRSFLYWNRYKMYGNNESYKKNYLSNKEHLASLCVGCGHCEEMCPQHLSIIEDLKKVVKQFES